MDELYNDADTDLIDRHFTGRATDSEQQEIKKRMETDSSFREKYRDTERVKQLVLAHERQQVWKKLAAEEKQFQASGSAGSSVPRFVYYAAAALVVVAMGISWYWLKPDANSQLVAEYYQPYDELGFPKSRGGGELEAAVQQAVELYHEKRYDEVIQLLTDLDGKDDRAFFVLGLAQIGQGQYERALENFNQVSPQFDQPDVYHWYKGLVLLQLGKVEECKTELSKIESDRFPVVALLQAME